MAGFLSQPSSAMAVIAANKWESGGSSKLPMPNPRISHKSMYEDNYSYGFSAYQPMIDYLDKKLQGISTASEELPHLPFYDEIGLESRPTSGSSLRRTNSYTKRELDSFVHASDSKSGLTRRATYAAGRPSTSTSNVHATRLGGSSSNTDIPFGSESKMKLTGSKSYSSLSSQYSMSKESVRQAIMSTSPSIAAMKEKFQKIVLEQKMEKAKKVIMPPRRIIPESILNDDINVRKSRSFGAFTEKSVKDTETKLELDKFKNKLEVYKRPKFSTSYALTASMNASDQQPSSSIVAARKVCFEQNSQNASVLPSPYSTSFLQRRKPMLESKVIRRNQIESGSEDLRETW